MNKLDRASRAQILTLLCEGMSIRAITRTLGVGKNTVARLLVDAGVACAAYQDRVLRNLPCERVQVDEICSAYCREIMALPQMAEWIAAAQLEPDEFDELDMEF